MNLAQSITPGMLNKKSSIMQDDDYFFLSMDQFLRYQARRKSCYCTCCGGDLKNQRLKKKAAYVDTEEALLNELEKVK